MNIIRFIISLWRFIRYHRILNKVYRDDEIIAKVSHALGTQFRRDWVNRIYGVINPEIRDGVYNPEQIIEYTEYGRDNSMWIEKYIMDHMNTLRSFIYTENLFEILTFSITPLGHSNYLFILEPITWGTLKTRFKYFIMELVMVIIALILLKIYI